MSITTLALQNSAPPRLLVGLIASFPIFGFQVGTGGASTLDYLKTRGSKGYAFVSYDTGSLSSSAALRTTSPADDLEHIRRILHTSITDLAKTFRVSRQAIYDWQSGRPAKQEHATRLRELARAADLFTAEGLEPTPHMIRRPIAKGKNLFDIVQDGGSAESAARSLIDMIRKEAAQRELMKSRLAKRPRPDRQEFDHLGAPVFNEQD
jgi:DNA-binding transcriptional regulator YiaG